MPKTTLLEVYDNALGSSLTFDKDIRRLLKLRPSGLPFCPTGFLLSYLRDEFKTSQTMANTFFFSLGHAVHETLQQYLSFSQPDNFIANFTCDVCKKEYKFTHAQKCCGELTQYHELRLKAPGIQGSMDLLYQDGKKKYIVDIKTMPLGKSSTILENVPNNYIEQVLAYAYMLYRQHNILVDGCVIFFVARNDPYRPLVHELPVTKKILAQTRDRIKSWRITQQQCLDVTTKNDIWKLVNISTCSNAYCQFCHLSSKEKRRLIVNYFGKRKWPMREAIKDTL